MINIQINYPIDFGHEVCGVTFTADCYITNDGIGAYEYCGSVEIDKGQDYVECENIKWDHFLFTPHENYTIKMAMRSLGFKSAFQDAYYDYIDNLDIL